MRSSPFELWREIVPVFLATTLQQGKNWSFHIFICSLGMTRRLCLIYWSSELHALLLSHVQINQFSYQNLGRNSDIIHLVLYNCTNLNNLLDLKIQQQFGHYKCPNNYHSNYEYYNPRVHAFLTYIGLGSWLDVHHLPFYITSTKLWNSISLDDCMSH